MKNCVIYTRVSTDTQEDKSQKTDLRKWAKQNDYKIIKEFGEKVSGYDKEAERTALEVELLSFVKENAIKNILIWSMSRLGRRVISTLKYVETFKAEGINIHFKKENLDTLSDNPMTNLMMTILMAFAQMERETIIEQSNRGKMQSALDGKATGFGTMPYGITAKRKGKLEINEDEANIVRMIYDLAIEGKSTHRIAEILNSKKIATRRQIQGRKSVSKGKYIKPSWRPNTVNNILRNSIYKGERTYMDQTIMLPVEIIIIDEEKWKKVQQRFIENIGNLNKKTKHEYLLKGKCVCGKCDHAFASRSERGTEFYNCAAKKIPHVMCRNGQIKAKPVENAVYDLLFRHADVMTQLSDEEKQSFDLPAKKEEIKFWKKKVEELESEKRRNIYLFKKSLITETELEKEITQINNSTSSAKREIRKIENDITRFERGTENILETFKMYATNEDYDTRKEVIEKWVDKISFYKVDEYDIDFPSLNEFELFGGGVAPKKKEYRKPHGNDKIMYIELFAFGSTTPIRAVVTSVTELSYSSQYLEYDNQKSFLTLTDYTR